MYAIIETGGKQVRVEPGLRLRVDHLAGEAGDSVSLDNVLLISDDEGTRVGTPHLSDTPVVAKIVGHGKEKKVRVIKMKRRKNYRRTHGHRQQYTEIEVMSIGASTEIETAIPVAPDNDQIETQEQS